MFKGQYNPVVIKPKLKEISKKRSKKEWELQEVRIKNVSWSEYLIDQTISCTEERKAVLKRALRKNCQLDQVHIYTDGSLKEDHTGNKRLGYALVQIGTTEENSYKIKG